MALLVTVSVVVIAVYQIMGFKNRKTMSKNIATILEELEYQNCRPKRKRKKEEVEEYEENEPEN